MEFILFLAAKEKEILELINKAGFSVEENTPLCFLGDRYVGFIKKRQRTVVICTENAKINNGYFLPGPSHNNAKNRTAISIRKALRHEATHVAQDCNDSQLLGIFKQNINIHKWYKRNAIIASTSIGNIKEQREAEAYYMEDRPNTVISALKKYCL